LAKLLRRGEVEGVMLGGRMYFSRRQLEKLVGRKGVTVTPGLREPVIQMIRVAIGLPTQ
jgi:hypothetical protein